MAGACARTWRRQSLDGPWPLGLLLCLLLHHRAVRECEPAWGVSANRQLQCVRLSGPYREQHSQQPAGAVKRPDAPFPASLPAHWTGFKRGTRGACLPSNQRWLDVLLQAGVGCKHA